MEEEPERRLCIGTAGNTDAPALLVLRAKGFRVWLEYTKVDDIKHPWHPYKSHYQAEKDGAYFNADSPVEMLGLVAMWESRGDDWRFRQGEPNILNELMESAKTFDCDGNKLPDE